MFEENLNKSRQIRYVESYDTNERLLKYLSTRSPVTEYMQSEDDARDSSNLSDERASRRAFLKYAGCGLAALVGAAASAYCLIKPELTQRVLPELRVSYTPDEKAPLSQRVILSDQLFQPSAFVTGAVLPVTVSWYVDDYVTPISMLNKPDPIALTPGEHYPRLVVVDSAGRRREIHLPKIVQVGDPFIPSGKYGVVQQLSFSVPEYELSNLIRQIAEAGIQFVRMGFRWDMIENVKGVLDFATFDAITSQLRGKGIQVLAVANGSAGWASSGSGRYFSDYPPRDFGEFGGFIGRVVEHYYVDRRDDGPGTPRIDCYEIWNEENIIEFWRPKPDPANYVELLKAAYYAAKYADPSCCVVLGGLAGNGVDMGWESAEGKHFLQKIYDNGGKGFFDVVAIHPYMYPVPTSSALTSLQEKVNAVKTVIKRNHDDRPLWITEIGWSTFPNAQNKPTVTEEEVAVWLTKVYTELRGVDKIFWYNFRDVGINPDDVAHHFGLTRSDGSLKPAYFAYKKTIEESREAGG